MTLAGRFRLTRLLGRGALGEVWLATELREGRPVALKVPGAAPGAAALLRAGFEQARRLVHPGIARLHEFVDGPPQFLVMEYVAGTGLGTLRGAGFREVLGALLPVAEALEHAHRQGIVHRDLKVANVLRDESGRCVIVDFGSGAWAGGGTLPAMSPQQLDGEPPAVSDDVYAFGALLYDLLAGQPLFHPGITAERIHGETPALPLCDLAGERLPEALRRLLGALLQKSAAQRPPGMAAVRSALEEILRDQSARASVIRPLERGESAPAAARTPVASRSGLPAAVVYGALAFCVTLAGAVFFYLPGVVRERGPLLSPAPVAPPAAVSPDAPPPGTAPPVPQQLLDDTLGEFLKADDELRQRNAEKWGGADWAELRRLAQAGDAAYRQRDSAVALASYRTAATLAKGLLARAPEMLAAALREGAAALEAGDQAQAVARFETALAVAADNAEAARGLARARRLDELLGLMGQANAAEAAGDRALALRLYRQAATLDPAWRAASEGVARLEQAAARDAYETQMARGFAAQASGDLAAARAAFEAALRTRPGDAPASAALAQADADQSLARLAALQGEARALEQAERWDEAARRYEAALATDANLADARAGLARARERAALDQRLRRELGNADRFNDDAVLGQARAVLATARAVAAPGPVLARQIAELEALLAVAVTPVRVTLESDNLTEVTLFKVGRLGVFSSKTLDLRPGAYTAVGSRPGYRDVRRSFRVGPGAAAGPVVVRCEEPI